MAGDVTAEYSESFISVSEAGEREAEAPDVDADADADAEAAMSPAPTSASAVTTVSPLPTDVGAGAGGVSAEASPADAASASEIEEDSFDVSADGSLSRSDVLRSSGEGDGLAGFDVVEPASAARALSPAHDPLSTFDHVEPAEPGVSLSPAPTLGQGVSASSPLAVSGDLSELSDSFAESSQFDIDATADIVSLDHSRTAFSAMDHVEGVGAGAGADSVDLEATMDVVSVDVDASRDALLGLDHVEGISTQASGAASSSTISDGDSDTLEMTADVVSVDVSAPHDALLRLDHVEPAGSLPALAGFDVVEHALPPAPLPAVVHDHSLELEVTSDDVSADLTAVSFDHVEDVSVVLSPRSDLDMTAEDVSLGSNPSQDPLLGFDHVEELGTAPVDPDGSGAEDVALLARSSDSASGDHEEAPGPGTGVQLALTPDCPPSNPTTASPSGSIAAAPSPRADDDDDDDDDDLYDFSSLPSITPARSSVPSLPMLGSPSSATAPATSKPAERSPRAIDEDVKGKWASSVRSYAEELLEHLSDDMHLDLDVYLQLEREREARDGVDEHIQIRNKVVFDAVCEKLDELAHCAPRVAPPAFVSAPALPSRAPQLNDLKAQLLEYVCSTSKSCATPLNPMMGPHRIARVDAMVRSEMWNGSRAWMDSAEEEMQVYTDLSSHLLDLLLDDTVAEVSDVLHQRAAKLGNAQPE